MSRRNEISGKSIGFVPTMGALHRGHVSLVQRCRRENNIVVVSLFVNPSQFNNPEDLKRYPRTWESDLALLSELGTDEVIAPGVSDLYPNGYRFRVEAESVTDAMEGVHRPGFFQGMMTVVLKLLNLVRADRTYFGEKDYQQLMIVREMAAEFFIPTEIVACPTIRAESGLAESSRNARLSPAGHRKAAMLFGALTTAANAGEAKTILETEGFSVDYVEEHWGRRFAAAVLEGVRLIDNVALMRREKKDASLP
jgi:pantoate--beta-alanine ligase